MDRDPSFRDANRKRRIPCRQQLDLLPSLAQSTKRQKSLALPASPFPLQIHVEQPHGVRAPPERSAASTSFPSFLNFSQVPGAASHMAALQLRLPWENNSWAMTVV